VKIESPTEIVRRVRAELAKPSPYNADGAVKAPLSRQVRVDLEELVMLVDQTLPKEGSPTVTDIPRRRPEQEYKSG
jgi:hypothetical protein